MKLTTKNVKKFLDQLNKGNRPCKKGMEAFDNILSRKRSMEWVFDKMNAMRRSEDEISYAHWLQDRVRAKLYRVGAHIDSSRYIPTFKNFKYLFNKLPED